MKPFPEAGDLDPRRHPRRRSPLKSLLFNWKSLAIISGLVYILYCFLFNLPIFAHPLPKHTGPDAVGAIDVEAPANPARNIDPNIHFKDDSPSAKPFQLDTVLFTLYYPATYADAKSSTAKRHPWIPHPISLRARGYARAAHISNWITDSLFTFAIKALVGSITIPAAVDVPLSDHATRESKFVTAWNKPEFAAQEVLGGGKSRPERNDAGHPVIIFSHGTVSSRTDYSHYAGELAARGYIVAMLEHRDGSSPGSIIMSAHQNRTVLLFDESEVSTQDGSPVSKPDFHKSQLAFREAEIEEVVRVLKQINAGEGGTVFSQNPRNEGIDLQNWAGRLNTEEMIISGHSYGATGALQALRGGPNNPKRPFKGGLILDPGKSSGPLNKDIQVPLLIVHSNTWSSHSSLFYDGRAHFDTVKEIVEENNQRGNPSWFMTSLGTSHPSVTDAPLLEPFLLSFTTGATINVYQGLRQYVHVAEDFLGFLGDGQPRGLLKEKAEFPQYDAGMGWGVWKPGQNSSSTERDKEAWEEKGEWWDWRRYWQVHVSPVGEEEMGGEKGQE